ncbi:MAG: alpha/beta fold hydrolase [Hydrogenophaga sp.]|uniref:alpha/beta hydrolase family protein n=1 Tax=Hydrogenophaga sp. TaxID=1904254 RepID=UPI00273208A8|nr:alpha/beta fold hydrolase [Hydrogenophaga sp.]MDP2164697.1 alpha/beta fold hydrolase [Hydrogenophaga sp.]
MNPEQSANKSPAASDAAVQERALEDVKQDVLKRIGKRSPFEDTTRDDVDTVLNNLTSLDSDHWAEQWGKMGAQHELKAEQLALNGAAAQEIADAHFRAFNYYRIGRYPVTSTPGKMAAYRHALRNFLKAARCFDQPLEVVEIPFEGKKVVGYLQVPRSVARPPLIMHWGGVDGWKEDRQRNSRALHRAGFATFTMDMPGTGENPLRYADPGAERTFSAAIDHLIARDDVDGTRIGVWGGSFGGYWAAKLAYIEAERIKAAVNHGGGVHYGFQETWLRPALTRTASQYLLGPASLLDARSYVMGVSTLDELLAIAPTLSLREQGLLERPSVPLLLVNGKKDDQQPIDDLYLMLEYGNPKAARVYPEGGHMGRSRGTGDAQIAEGIITWLQSRLAT